MSTPTGEKEAETEVQAAQPASPVSGTMQSSGTMAPQQNTVQVGTQPPPTMEQKEELSTQRRRTAAAQNDGHSSEMLSVIRAMQQQQEQQARQWQLQFRTAEQTDSGVGGEP